MLKKAAFFLKHVHCKVLYYVVVKYCHLYVTDIEPYIFCSPTLCNSKGTENAGDFEYTCLEVVTLYGRPCNDVCDIVYRPDLAPHKEITV